MYVIISGWKECDICDLPGFNGKKKVDTRKLVKEDNVNTMSSSTKSRLFFLIIIQFVQQKENGTSRRLWWRNVNSFSSTNETLQQSGWTFCRLKIFPLDPRNFFAGVSHCYINNPDSYSLTENSDNLLSPKSHRAKKKKLLWYQSTLGLSNHERVIITSWLTQEARGGQNPIFTTRFQIKLRTMVMMAYINSLQPRAPANIESFASFEQIFFTHLFF